MSEDQRAEELEVLKVIYPELKIESYTAYLELPIVLPSPLHISSPQREHEILHLPAICTSFTLPNEYPDTQPPLVEVKATWLSAPLVTELEFKAARLWKELEGTGILYSYIMEIEEAAEQKFGFEEMRVEDDFLTHLIEYDSTAKRKEFQRSSHECSVCIETKTGDQCYSMEHCGHIFCVECLQTCYNAAIQGGDIDSIKCLSYNCGAEDMDNRARRVKRIRHIAPQELLKIPIEREKVERYVKLKRKRLLEADRSTIWCPKQICQGAARGNNYPKSTVPLEEMGESDTEDEKPMALSIQKMTIQPPSDETNETTLAVCEDCNFAFCTECRAGWHGTYNNCYGGLNKKELLRKEEKASKGSEKRRQEEEELTRAYLLTDTSPCPKCRTSVSKIEACNHITCRQCTTHFCYLCSAPIDPMSPLAHFNTKGSSCYGRLWVLVDGGSESKVQFGGIRGAEARLRNLSLEAERLKTMGVRGRLRLIEKQIERAKKDLERLRKERPGGDAAQ
ncbi:hypothetical protein GRF29_1g2301522 [Pseudopithomyces chartarum]|uniref:RBR-type E3 ubiquitin transferase n=1 Tax=Pseudopithomyces chartarum TaxID=1892770 RepID=A0AAN6M8P9_9PLEO|nr:hypothetical protein GRF29_1g2301522 [Pseudopithomyces chartarum]